MYLIRNKFLSIIRFNKNNNIKINTIKTNNIKPNQDILIARNNILSDTIEKITCSPYIYNDNDEIYNKEIAFIYSLIILGTISYIIIIDHINKK
jgi:hypothetical protein